MISEILAVLEFDIGDREFILDEIEDTIDEDMETDKEEKLDQPSF